MEYVHVSVTPHGKRRKYESRARRVKRAVTTVLHLLTNVVNSTLAYTGSLRLNIWKRVEEAPLKCWCIVVI